MVGTARFELATPCTPCKCATRLRYVPNPDKPENLILSHICFARIRIQGKLIVKSMETDFKRTLLPPLEPNGQVSPWFRRHWF